jgi:hypothetical protein
MGKFSLSGIMRGRQPNGEEIVVMPGVPIGSSMGKLVGLNNIVKYPKYFMARTMMQVAGESADSRCLLEDNAKANVRIGGEDWAHLWGQENRICLLIGAGPSLTESLPEIAELVKDKDQYFTLGVNRAIKAIDLDYYMVIDRRCERDWVVDRDVARTKLIAATTARADIVKWFGKRYYGELLVGGVDEGFAPLRSGFPITVCDAMHAAFKLGATEIWLYGCDFGVSGDLDEENQQYLLGKYYFDLPLHSGMKIRPERLQELHPVIGKGGKVVFTNMELWSYAQCVSAMAMMIEESGDVPVWNKTPVGLLDWAERQMSAPGFCVVDWAGKENGEGDGEDGDEGLNDED